MNPTRIQTNKTFEQQTNKQQTLHLKQYVNNMKTYLKHVNPTKHQTTNKQTHKETTNIMIKTICK